MLNPKVNYKLNLSLDEKNQLRKLFRTQFGYPANRPKRLGLMQLGLRQSDL